MIYKRLSLLILLLLCMISGAAAHAEDTAEIPKEAAFLKDMGVLNDYSPEAAVSKQTVQNSLEILGTAVSSDKYFKSKDYTEPATVKETAAVLADMTGRGYMLAKDNVLSVAAAAGISVPSGYKADDYITMECFSKMLYDALSAKLVKLETVSGNKRTYTTGEETYLSSYLKMYEIKGIVTATGKTGLKSNVTAGKNCIAIDGTSLRFEGDESRFDEYLGMNVTVLCRDNGGDDELVSLYIPQNKNKTAVINSRDIIASKTNVKTVQAYTPRETEYRIADDAAYIYNGIFADYINDEDIRVEEGYITLVDSNGDSKYDTVKIISFESTVISQISEENARITGKNKKVYDLEAIINRGEGSIYDENGKTISVSELKKNDTVSVGYEKGTAKAVLVQRGKRISGKVTSLADGSVYIDQTEYTISASLKNKKSGYTMDKVTPGTEITAYINATGDFVGAEVIQNTDLYGYMTRLYEEDGGDAVKIKLFGADGEFHEYELNDKVTFNSGRKSGRELADKSDAALWNRGKLKHQPILYRVNSEGRLTKLITAVDNNRYASYDKNNFSLDYSGELRYLTGDWQSLGSLYKLDSDTVIINVPYNIEDEDLFYTVNPSGWGNWTFNIELYDVDEKFFIGMAILRKPDYTLQQASFKGNKPIIVDKVYRSVNDDNEPIYEIEGWRNGAKYSIKTRNINTFATLMPTEIKNKQGLSLPPSDAGKKVFSVGDLKPGSVIQPMLNNERLTGFTLFYDGETPVYYEYSTYTLPAALTDTECMVLSGRVHDLTKNGFLYTKNEPGEEITVMRNISISSSVKIYLAENGKVRECTRDELTAGDKVLMYYDYATLNLVVIQR